MTYNALNVLAGIGGLGDAFELAWVADQATGLTLPTDPYVALASGFKSLGIIDENGANEDVNIATQGIDAYGAGAPVRTLITSETRTIKFNCRETRPETIALADRLPIASVVPSGGGVVSTNVGARRDARYAIVLHATDGPNIIRAVIPNARMIALGTRSIAKSANIRYDFTFQADLDASGNSIYRYFALQSFGAS